VGIAAPAAAGTFGGAEAAAPGCPEASEASMAIVSKAARRVSDAWGGGWLELRAARPRRPACKTSETAMLWRRAMGIGLPPALYR
jgi:hypothetical protein